MKVITRSSLAKCAAKHWKTQYCDPSSKCYADPYDTELRKQTYQRLIALGDKPDPDEVDSIIGNTSWTRTPKCNECNTYDHAIIIELGDEPDYDSNTVWICLGCITKLNQLIGELEL